MVFTAKHTLWMLLLTAFSATAIAETAMERGEYLVNSIVACGNCHTDQTPAGPDLQRRFAGRLIEKGPAFTAYASNITPDKKTGIGHYNQADLVRAIREGKRPDGSLIGPPMPIGLYRGLSDRDVNAIATYVLAQRPIENAVPRSEYNIPLPPSYGPAVNSIDEIDRADELAYGAYLAGPAGHCIECHTPMVNGRPDYENQLGAGGFVFHGPWGASVSPNLTSHPELGLARYTDAQVESMIRSGKHATGRPMLPPMGYAYYRNINDADMRALIKYLRSLPAKTTPSP